MYYVLWAGAGNEARVEQLIRRLIPEEFYQECFYPIRHLRKKIRGSWKDVYERLIPGYLFLTTDHIQDFSRAIFNFPLFLDILGKTEVEEETVFFPLSEREQKWLETIVQKEVPSAGKTPDTGKYIAELSQIGFDEDDQIEILSGPLKDFRGKIKKINLHKRIAEVEVDFMNTTTVLYLGIEIINKVDERNCGWSRVKKLPDGEPGYLKTE